MDTFFVFLLQQRVLPTPALYISYFLKRNRIEYYDRMSEVRRKDDYEQWVKFFLQAIYESAEDAKSQEAGRKVLHPGFYKTI